MSSGEVETRSAGVELGQTLVDTDFIHHVVDEHYFEDAYLFFRFRQDGEEVVHGRVGGHRCTHAVRLY